MDQNLSRRTFLRTTTTVGIGIGLGQSASWSTPEGCSSKPFQISLAQWSLHRAIFDGKLDALDFARTAKEEFGISAVEYVNQFYKDHGGDDSYFKDLKSRADDAGVRSLLIMVDGEGALGSKLEAERKKVVENHYKWIEAAHMLGCHSIRVNAAGPGGREELASAVIDGLGRLSEFAETAGINVIVENHGGFSSDGQWLLGVVSKVSMANCGTLPDFDNFCIRKEPNEEGKLICVEEYDRYQGVKELMPFAKAVSAKSYHFYDDGNETLIDYPRIMKIVLDAGYNGYVGIEYEGHIDDEYTGIRKTRDLLLRIRESRMG